MRFIAAFLLFQKGCRKSTGANERVSGNVDAVRHRQCRKVLYHLPTGSPSLCSGITRG